MLFLVSFIRFKGTQIPSRISYFKNLPTYVKLRKSLGEEVRHLSVTMPLNMRIIDHGMGKFFIFCVKQKKKKRKSWFSGKA